MGTIYRQKGRLTWMIKYYRDGRPIVESSGTQDWTKARGILRDREAAVERGDLVIGVSRIRFEEGARALLEDYRVNGRSTTARVKARIDKHLAPVFNGRRLASITTSEIRDYITARLDEGAAAATINRELAALKRIFRLAMQDGRLGRRPHIPMLEEHNVRQGFFEREQFESVRAHLPAWLRPVATFAYVTGWRVQSEVLPLQWRQVDFEAGTVRLDPGTTKNDEGRLFPFDVMPELRDVLIEQNAEAARLKAEGRIVPWVFHHDGAPLLTNGLATNDVRTTWRAACRAAGCPGRLLHDFRRTAVRNLVRAGVPEKTAMLLTGHKTRSVFDRYDIVNEADLRDAVARLTGTDSHTANQNANRRGRSRAVSGGRERKNR